MSYESSSVSDKVRGASLSNKKTPVFLRRVFSLLQNNKMTDVVDWSADGETFVIKNPREFAEQLLPQMFNHGNLASFIRQLNMYSFVKVKDDAYQHAYSHKFFKRDREELIYQIERKKKYKKNPGEGKKEKAQVSQQQPQPTQQTSNAAKKQDINQLLYENDILKMIKNDLTYQLEAAGNEIQQAHIRNHQKCLRYEELRKENTRLQSYFIQLKAMQFSTGQLKSCLPPNMFCDPRAAAAGGFDLNHPGFFDPQNMNGPQINEMSVNLVTSLKNAGQPLIFGMQSTVEYKNEKEPQFERVQTIQPEINKMNAYGIENKFQVSEANFGSEAANMNKANILKNYEHPGPYFSTGLTYWAKAVPDTNSFAIQ